MKKSLSVLFGVTCVLCFAGRLCFGELSQSQRQEISLHYYRGVVNFEGGNYENAFTEFTAVSKIDPYYKENKKYLKECVDALEKYRGDLFKEAGDKAAGPKADFDYYFLGKSFYEKGEYKKALDAFKAVLEKNPNDRFSLYYAELCKQALAKTPEPVKRNLAPEEALGEEVLDMDKTMSYVKEDMRSQEENEQFLAIKAQRMVDRDELISKKERELGRQEQLLKEEREDYLAEARLSKRAEQVKRNVEKYKSMKEKLASKQPGIPAETTEFPVYLSRGDTYYAHMKDHLRNSRWHSAGLNAIQASLYYCDALLIYFYNVKSSFPGHDNINRLLLMYVKRPDVEENVFRMRSILNLKKLAEDEDKPFTRSQAIFLANETEKVAEWCKTILP